MFGEPKQFLRQWSSEKKQKWAHDSCGKCSFESFLFNHENVLTEVVISHCNIPFVCSSSHAFLCTTYAFAYDSVGYELKTDARVQNEFFGRDNNLAVTVYLSLLTSDLAHVAAPYLRFL